MKLKFQNRISDAISRGIKLGLELYGDEIQDISLDKDLLDILKLKEFNILDPYKCLKDRHIEKFIQGDMSFSWILKDLCCNYCDDYYGVYHIKNDNEFLYELIRKLCSVFGNSINLNWIDVSNIENMYQLFKELDFNGDISLWDVSNVKNMSCMFYHSKFNGDISKWDVSNVINMPYMFCGSLFNGDISLWNVSNVKVMFMMFYQSRFNQDISNWNIKFPNRWLEAFMWKEGFYKDKPIIHISRENLPKKILKYL